MKGVRVRDNVGKRLGVLAFAAIALAACGSTAGTTSKASVTTRESAATSGPQTTPTTTRPAPITTKATAPTTVPHPVAPVMAPASSCTPGYDPCIAPGSDVDCAGGSGNGPRYVDGPVYVTGPDVYDLDRDGNGVGCQA